MGNGKKGGQLQVKSKMATDETGWKNIGPIKIMPQNEAHVDNDCRERKS